MLCHPYPSLFQSVLCNPYLSLFQSVLCHPYLSLFQSVMCHPYPSLFQSVLCHPYLSLQYFDLLQDVNVRGFLIGASNMLFRQKKHLLDVVIEVRG